MSIDDETAKSIGVVLILLSVPVFAVSGSLLISSLPIGVALLFANWFANQRDRDQDQDGGAKA